VDDKVLSLVLDLEVGSFPPRPPAGSPVPVGAASQLRADQAEAELLVDALPQLSPGVAAALQAQPQGIRTLCRVAFLPAPLEPATS
jgi:hypothetical protein